MIIYPKGYSKRTINSFMFLVYPDSAPHDWLNRLEDLQIPCAVSPCHDMDLNEDGEFKKPHYHVLVHFDGGKGEALCQGIIDDVVGENGNSSGEVVRSLGASVRYLVHADSDRKHQYSISDIVCFGGFDVNSYFENTDRQDLALLTSVLDFIKVNQCFYFSDLIDYMASCQPSWLLAMRNIWFSSLVKEYQRSLLARGTSFNHKSLKL